MFWLVKKSKKKINLISFKTNLFFTQTDTKPHSKLGASLRRRRFDKKHVWAVRRIKSRTRAVRSGKLHFIRRKQRYRKYWRKVFRRKLQKIAGIKISTKASWRNVRPKPWLVCMDLPIIVLKFGNTERGGKEGLLRVGVVKYSTHNGLGNLVNPGSGGFGKAFGNFSGNTYNRGRLHKWRTAFRNLKKNRRRRLPRFKRRKIGYNNLIKQRAVFLKKRLLFNYRVHSKQMPNIAHKFRGTVKNCNPITGVKQKKITKPSTHLRNYKIPTTRVRGLNGRFLKKKNALKHFYWQNMARSFEFENWTFWEEFIAEKDHSKSLIGIKNSLMQYESRGRLKFHKTLNAGGKVGGTPRGHLYKTFLINRHMGYSGVKSAFYVDKLVKLFTVSPPSWETLLRLLHSVIKLLTNRRRVLGTESLLLLKQAMFLITELDYLVIYRIQSGILPTYRMDRSTRRGYSKVRNKLRDFKLYLRESRGRVGNATISSTKVTEKGVGYVHHNISRYLFWKKKKKYQKHLGILRTNWFLIRLADKYLNQFWSRGVSLRKFMALGMVKRPEFHRRAMVNYFRLNPRRRAWRKRTSRNLRKNRSMLRKFRVRLRRLHAVKKRTRPKFYLKRPQIPINSKFRYVRPRHSPNPSVVVGFRRNSTDQARRTLPNGKGVEEQLSVTKRKIPKFRVQNKLRSIRLRGVIQKIKLQTSRHFKTSLRTGQNQPRLSMSVATKEHRFRERFGRCRTGSRVSVRAQLSNSLYKYETHRHKPITTGTCGKVSGFFNVPNRSVVLRKKNSKKNRVVGKMSNFIKFLTFAGSKVRENIIHPFKPFWQDELLIRTLNDTTPWKYHTMRFSAIKLPKTPTHKQSSSKQGPVTAVTYDQKTKLGRLIDMLRAGLKPSVRKKKKRWLSPKTKASFVQAHRADFSMGLANVNLKVMASIGIKFSLQKVIGELTNAMRVLPLGVRRFFNKSKYIFTIMLLMVYMDVSVWSSYLNRVFFRTKSFRQRRLFNSLRALLPRTAIACGMYASIRGMYMSFKGKVASRGGLRKRTLRVGYGWYSSANFGLQYRYRFKQIWSKSGAIGLKTIITCGNMHKNIHTRPSKD